MSIMIGECNPIRITVAVSVAMDGSKLPLFVILNYSLVGRSTTLFLRFYEKKLLAVCSQKDG